MVYQVQGRMLDFSKPQVMGILNLTTDSFYDGGKYLEYDAIRQRIEDIANEGASVIDIGAASSKPGSSLISPEEELEKLPQAIAMVQEIAPQLFISIDTYNSQTAATCIDLGAHIVNDISCGSLDDNMLNVLSNAPCVYVGMHMDGTPQSMQDDPQYDNVAMEVLTYFKNKCSLMRSQGVQFVIDPGFGFGKTIDHNYELLDKLEVFSMLDTPILVGLSRKSMIYKLVGGEPSTSLPGTLGLTMIALQKGARILRVHDVAESVQLVKVFNKTNRNIKIQ